MKIYADFYAESLIYAEFTLKTRAARLAFLPRVFYGSIPQSAVVAAERKITLHLPSQHHLGILQGLIIQQPVQFCPLCRGVAVLILDGDAVDGKGGV